MVRPTNARRLVTAAAPKFETASKRIGRRAFGQRGFPAAPIANKNAPQFPAERFFFPACQLQAQRRVARRKRIKPPNPSNAPVAGSGTTWIV